MIEEGTYFGPYGGELILHDIDDGTYAWAVGHRSFLFQNHFNLFHLGF